MQQFISQQEHAGCAGVVPPTPHHSSALHLGQKEKTGRRPHRGSPDLRWQSSSCSHNHLIPSHCTTQPCPRSWMNTTEKGTWIWAASEHRCLHRWDTGILWPHRSYLLQDSPPLGQCAHSRATEHDQTQPSTLLFKQLGSAPYSQ